LTVWRAKITSQRAWGAATLREALFRLRTGSDPPESEISPSEGENRLISPSEGESLKTGLLSPVWRFWRAEMTSQRAWGAATLREALLRLRTGSEPVLTLETPRFPLLRGNLGDPGVRTPWSEESKLWAGFCGSEVTKPHFSRLDLSDLGSLAKRENLQRQLSEVCLSLRLRHVSAASRSACRNVQQRIENVSDQRRLYFDGGLCDGPLADERETSNVSVVP